MTSVTGLSVGFDVGWLDGAFEDSVVGCLDGSVVGFLEGDGMLVDSCGITVVNIAFVATDMVFVTMVDSGFFVL